MTVNTVRIWSSGVYDLLSQENLVEISTAGTLKPGISQGI